MAGYGYMPESEASYRRRTGRGRHCAYRAVSQCNVSNRRFRKAQCGRGSSAFGAFPVVVYYALSVAFVGCARPYYEHRLFLSVGPLTIGPDGWISFLAACTIVLASFSAGRVYLAAEGDGVWDALLASAVASSAAIGAYLACYTLLNPVILLVFAASLAVIVLRARLAGDVGLYAGVVRPVWFLFAALGVFTCAMWGWAVNPVKFDLQYSEVPENRRLAEHIDTAALFFDEGAWTLMTLGEKADALGEIVLVECSYLGVEEPPAIAVGACPDTVVACYDDSQNRITFNSSYLMTGIDGRVATEAAAHESAHRYQAECVRRGYALPPAESGWSSKETDEGTVANWAREFQEYVPYSEDAKRYAEQDCERSAYTYGLSSRCDIEARVDKYLSTGNPYA